MKSIFKSWFLGKIKIHPAIDVICLSTYLSLSDPIFWKKNSRSFFTSRNYTYEYDLADCLGRKEARRPTHFSQYQTFLHLPDELCYGYLFLKVQRKTWYSILRLDAMPLSLKNLLPTQIQPALSIFSSCSSKILYALFFRVLHIFSNWGSWNRAKVIQLCYLQYAGWTLHLRNLYQQLS